MEDHPAHRFAGFQPVLHWLAMCVLNLESDLWIDAATGRDPEYIKITTQYAQDVASNAAWLHVTPAILRP
jgi:hypothetical protein